MNFLSSQTVMVSGACTECIEPIASAVAASSASAVTPPTIRDRPNRLPDDGSIATHIGIADFYSLILSNPVSRIEPSWTICRKFDRGTSGVSKPDEWSGVRRGIARHSPRVSDDALLDDPDDRPVLLVSFRLKRHAFTRLKPDRDQIQLALVTPGRCGNRGYDLRLFRSRRPHVGVLPIVICAFRY